MGDQFRHTDTRKPDGLHIQWARLIVDDECSDRPDERDDGFWPSHDPKAAGYVGKDGDYAASYEAARARMDAWKRGDWNYVGVRAQARCMVVENGHGTYYTLQSAGVYGVESDAGDYLDTLYQEEKAQLAADMRKLGGTPVEQEDVD